MANFSTLFHQHIPHIPFFPALIIFGCFLKWPTADHRSIVCLRLVAIIYGGDFNSITSHKFFCKLWHTRVFLSRLFLLSFWFEWTKSGKCARANRDLCFKWGQMQSSRMRRLIREERSKKVDTKIIWNSELFWQLFYDK